MQTLSPSTSDQVQSQSSIQTPQNTPIPSPHSQIPEPATHTSPTAPTNSSNNSPNIPENSQNSSPPSPPSAPAKPANIHRMITRSKSGHP